MEPGFALLLPLVGGYLYVVGYSATKYLIAREEGHRLYFRVAYHGVCLFLCALALFGGVGWGLSQFQWFASAHEKLVALVAPLLKSRDHASAQVAFVIVCFGSVFLGRLAPVVLNRLRKNSIDDAVWKAAQENELEEFLLEAVALLRTVSITLTAGKVYVGIVLTTPEPKTDRRVITLLPYMSGYREEKGQVVFTTFYDQFYQEPTDADAERFRLVLPLDKMQSISYFDMEIYERFNSPRVEPRRVRRKTS